MICLSFLAHTGLVGCISEAGESSNKLCDQGHCDECSPLLTSPDVRIRTPSSWMSASDKGMGAVGLGTVFHV